MRIQCGHCREYHESVAQVRQCAKAIPGTKPPKWLRQAKEQTSPSLPTDVKVAADGTVTWTNPKHNPWKDIHHDAEQDYTGGEYTRGKARAAVEMEYRQTERYGWLCPNVNCTDGYMHYRATVAASWCANCRTGGTAGGGEVFSKPEDFEPAQWYLLKIVRWTIAELKREDVLASVQAPLNQLVQDLFTEAQLVDLLRTEDALTTKKALPILRALVA